MAFGYKLTIEQNNLLIGVEYHPNMFFNPIKSVNGDFFISEIEFNLSEIEWVKQLQGFNYEPKIIELP